MEIHIEVAKCIGAYAFKNGLGAWPQRDWGFVNWLCAVGVYDGLVENFPEDFRVAYVQGYRAAEKA